MLLIDYESGCFERLVNRVNELHYRLSEFSREDLQPIKPLILDERVKCEKNIRCLILFYLGEVDDCLALIDTMDNVDVKIIKAYLDQGLINKELAISKCSNLSDDHKGIYQALDESSENANNIFKHDHIAKAFRAEKYQDVVCHYDKMSTRNITREHELISSLYYLLAQLYLNKTLNKEVLDHVYNEVATQGHESKALYQAFKCRQKIDALELPFKDPTKLRFKIDDNLNYREAVEILDSPDLTKHFLYERLVNELNSIKDKWNGLFYRQAFNEIKAKLSSGNMDSDDLLSFYYFGVECEEYDDLIASVTELHIKNSPTMTSYNCIGYCYERKNDFDSALKNYKLALDLMRSSQYDAFNVINNYISCAKWLDIDIPQQEFDELRKIFNTSIANKFKLNTNKGNSRQYLFKYSAFNINTIDSLTNQYFYLALKNQLNDPIELPNLKKVGLGHLIDSDYRICSSSKNDNSMLMWSHYAQEHQGIMVEYWFGGEFPDGFGVSQVSYNDEFKRNRETDLGLFNQYILTKNREWSYENEVRLFSNLGETVSYEIFDYPNTDRSKINARVCSITLGCKFPENKKKLIGNIVKSINGNRKNHEPKVTLKEAYIADDNPFVLKYRDCTL